MALGQVEMELSEALGRVSAHQLHCKPRVAGLVKEGCIGDFLALLGLVAIGVFTTPSCAREFGPAAEKVDEQISHGGIVRDLVGLERSTRWQAEITKGLCRGNVGVEVTRMRRK